jgi:prevent-host-death family protein
MDETPPIPTPEVAVRDLRNRGGEILDRVEHGESLTVTRDGRPVAELRPLPRRPLPAALLLQRWRHLPYVDPAQLRADIDSILDPSL